ncbi:MAG: endolytic transglycosylase MltG [Candidatus Liptonbacteria bacterium]|nr:endolytic transglycosylase MltG [Candidatus Liptonbacteria bacterium]
MRQFFFQRNADFPYKKAVFLCLALFLLLVIVSYAVIDLGAVAAPVPAPKSVVFTVAPGEGFKAIVGRLAAEQLIRSKTAFEVLSLATGAAGKFKPGTYDLNPGMTSFRILEELAAGPYEVEVTIPEGASVYEIDRILSGSKVIASGSLVAFNESSMIEGTLFPDTYKFFTQSKIDDVVTKFKENFSAKMADLSLDVRMDKGRADLIMASILEKEVPGEEDRRIVAGILQKRLKASMALNVDATICYVKQAASFPVLRSCYPLPPSDFKIASAYNTYLHRGLPPGAIGNPGLGAIEAVLRAKSSPYWYYLSDPKTKQTIFAETLEEQNINRQKYLGN